MTTYGIIVSRTEYKTIGDTPYFKYKVRLPLFHGYNQTGSTPDSSLPEAIVASLPHSELTTFNKGDLVVVSLIDYNLEDVVILGMLPNSKTEGLYGSFSTQSKMSLYNVEKMTFDRDGEVLLPYNTKIRTEDNRQFIDINNLSSLVGTSGNIQEQIDSIKNTRWVTKVLSKKEFDVLRNTNNLEENTLYYVYNNQ